MAGLSMTALDPAFNNDIVESAARISSGEGVRQQAEVAAEDYPLLVTFRDIRDPKSVATVDPVSLAARFGRGYRLHRMTVQIVSDDVTTGVSAKLPEFGTQTGYLRWRLSLPATDVRRDLTKYDFTRGMGD
jgi:hypothetical protein